MNSYTPIVTNNPHFSSIFFNDGSSLSSARYFDDVHVRKKLKTGEDASFDKDVSITGKLTVTGQVVFESTSIPDTSKTYVDEQLEILYDLIGWDSTANSWKYSLLENDPDNAVDARLQTLELNYYNKSETDTKILNSSTLALVYYNGSSNKYTDNEIITYSTPCSVIPSTNHFIIPYSTITKFIIQNSNYGAGKVLTSNANGEASWQDPTSTSNTVGSIVTSHGQTTTASFDIKDLATNTIRFIPSVSHRDYLVAQSGDSTMALNSGIMTIMTEETTRPAGIRICGKSNGFIEFYGGSAIEGLNPTCWLRDTENNYLGSRMGHMFRFDSTAIHLLHEATKSINLYGDVRILLRQTNTPSFNKNTYTINPSLQIGDAINEGSLQLYGNMITTNLKITQGAQANYVLTSDSNGNATWQPTQAIVTTVTGFSEDVTFDGDIDVAGNVHTEFFSSDNGLKITPVQNISTTLAADVTTQYRYWGSDPLVLDNRTYWEKNVTYYSSLESILIGQITIPPNYHQSVDMIIPLFLQHNWCWKKTGYGGIAKFTYQVDFIVINFTSTLATYTTNLNDPYQLGKFYAEYSRELWTDFASPYDYIEGHDLWCEWINSNYFFLDKIPVHFKPPINSSAVTYTISINVKLKYSSNADVASYTRGVQSSLFTPFHLSTGRKGLIHFTAQPNKSFLETLDTSYGNWLQWRTWRIKPFSNTGTVINLADEQPDNKGRHIKVIWYGVYDKQQGSGYYTRKYGGNYVITDYVYTPPPQITSAIPTINLSKNRNNFNYGYSKFTQAGVLQVDQLFVNSTIEIQGTINCLGYTTRQGVGSMTNDELSFRRSPHKEIIYNDIINFYWNGSTVETWINDLLLVTATPNVSDYRAKENIQKVKGKVLQRIKKLPIYTYQMRNVAMGLGEHLGIIAHELKEIFPEFTNLVSGEKDAVNSHGTQIYQRVNYNEVTILLMKGLQEVKEELDRLKLICYLLTLLSFLGLYFFFHFTL